MSYDLFQSEKDLIAQALSKLEGIDDATGISRKEFEMLLTGYKKLFKRTEQLVRLNDRNEVSLRLAKSAAEEATKAKATFLATMSHEIRTPMSGVIGMVDILQQTNLTDDQYQMVDTVRDSAYSLLTIINDILDFSKIEAGKLDLEEIPISVRDVVEGAGEALAVGARNKGIGLSVYVAPEIPDAVLGDPVRLRQILFNFGSNAIKFTAHGKVFIRADKVSSQTSGSVTIRFQVIDQGIGIPEEAQSSLFQAFSQVEASTTRRFGGTGLGLSICQRLTEMMNGEIGVQSVDGQGSTFSATINLPVAKEHDIKSDGQDLKGLNVLLVHSDNEMRQLIPRYLENWQANVATTADLDQVLSLAMDAITCGTPFDVICLGSNWPLEQRFDIIRSLQANEALASTNFVVTRGSRAKSDQKTLDNTVYVNSGPLHRADFIKSIAVAAGRATAERVRDDSGIKPKRTKTPTVNEAEAAGQLILLAEDNLTNQNVITRQLNMLGYAAVIANDGSEALELLKTKSFGILLTDCQMPNMDGYELTETIRRTDNDEDSHFPVVAITANVMKEEIERCFASGMDDCLAKPLEMDKLKAMLQKWLPEAEDAATQPLEEFDDEEAPDAPEAGIDTEVPIDPSVLRGVFGDDGDMLREILQDFIKPAQDIVNEIEEAYAAKSAPAVAAAAHKLKSSSRSVGANPLADLCAELEAAGKGSKWEQIDANFPHLGGRMQAVINYIEAF